MESVEAGQEEGGAVNGEAEAVVEVGAGASAEVVAAGSVAASEELEGAGEASETAAEASGASGEDVRPSEQEGVEAQEEDSEERGEVKAALKTPPRKSKHHFFTTISWQVLFKHILLL